MKVLYLDYQPGDKVYLKDANIEGRIMYITASMAGITYGVQSWDAGQSSVYNAWSWEISLVEEFEPADRPG